MPPTPHASGARRGLPESAHAASSGCINSIRWNWFVSAFPMSRKPNWKP
jgi:hypothetical protein